MLRNLQFWWKWSKIALYERSTIAADRVVLVELTKQVPGSASTVRSPDQSSFVELSYSSYYSYFFSDSYYMGQQMNSCTWLTARSLSPEQKFYFNDIRGCWAFQNIAPTLWKTNESLNANSSCSSLWFSKENLVSSSSAQRNINVVVSLMCFLDYCTYTFTAFLCILHDFECYTLHCLQFRFRTLYFQMSDCTVYKVKSAT